MNTTRLILLATAAALSSAGVVSVHAAEHSAPGVFYDPSNPASPTGKTIGYELFRTIGCPGRELLGSPCPVPSAIETAAADPAPADDSATSSAQPAALAATDEGSPIAAPGAAATPLAADSTAGGAGTSPTQPESLAAEGAPAAGPEAAAPARPSVLDPVNFDFDQATLRPEAHAVLDQAAAGLKDSGDRVEVAGHTDSIGSETYNRDLSLRRAETVRTYLIDKGIAADRLAIKGYSELQPVADNATREGRFQNRRVELRPQP